MRIAHRTTASALRAASFVVLSTVAAAGAMAATASTDMYSPDGIAASFGTPSPTAVRASEYNGSTDIYGVNGLAVSFGHAGAVAQTGDLRGAGSTDMYGYNGFAVSFGAPARRSAEEQTVSR
jgi:hypothetical protein